MISDKNLGRIAPLPHESFRVVSYCPASCPKMGLHKSVTKS